jgi:hypothetical protein
LYRHARGSDRVALGNLARISLRRRAYVVDAEPPSDLTPPEPPVEPASSAIPPDQEAEGRSLYRHPLAAVGGAFVLAGSLVFLLLVFIDLTSPNENTYRSLITYFAVPAVVVIGLLLFLIAVRRQVVNARRRGENVRFNLRIEPSSPRYMRSLWLFLGLGVALLLATGWAGFKGYEATDSVSFCGETCHAVMGPQATAYENSPHAQVLCAECHIGPGTSFWVRSKIDGIRQVIKTATNTYDRPIKTPVESLRPAQQTCEQCHWPSQFYGRKLVTKHYYRSDEANSPWTISMLVNIGGSAGTQDAGSDGIHWHMLAGKTIEYLAVDEKRQDIPWVRVVRDDGSVSTYADPNASYPDPADSATELRVFDCIDCHNRPSHQFLPPAVAINQEIASDTISRDLPYIRRVGLELLNSLYETQDEAEAAIRSTLAAYYSETYPDRVDDLGDEIAEAADTLVDIYRGNFFPEMKTDYRAHLDNVSHFVNDGCFRCHGSDMVDEAGTTISMECDSCHTIVAQGPSDDIDSLDQNLDGLEFVHPVDIGTQWEEINCTGCHTASEGY